MQSLSFTVTFVVFVLTSDVVRAEDYYQKQYMKPLEIKHVWHKYYADKYPDNYNDENAYGKDDYEQPKYKKVQTLVGYSKRYQWMDQPYKKAAYYAPSPSYGKSRSRFSYFV